MPGGSEADEDHARRRHRGSATAVGAGVVAGIAALAGCVAALAAHVALRQPSWATRLLTSQEVAVFSVPTTSRLVAITIDDGPHEHLTPGILDVLREHQARATFFVLGSRAEAHPELVSDAADAGHEIGNHGWLDRPAVRLSRPEFRDDLVRTAEAITAATGTAPSLVRPGSGWLRPGHLRDLRALGSTLALGSIATLDLEVTDVEREVAFILDRLRPGSVIVLHEGRTSRARVVLLLDRLLVELGRRGYEAVTLSQLLAARAAASHTGAPRTGASDRL